MRGKLLVVVGVAVGYVLGAKAGRGRYDDIARVAGKFWSSKTVQQQVTKVEDYAKGKAPDVVDFLSDGAKKVVSQAGKRSAAKRTVSRKSSTSETK